MKTNEYTLDKFYNIIKRSSDGIIQNQQSQIKENKVDNTKLLRELNKDFNEYQQFNTTNKFKLGKKNVK